MEATATIVEESSRASVAGKYFTFMCSSESFGIQILKVREIIGLVPITAIPQTPHYVKGIINLRGKVIPVLDLNLKFGMPEKEYDSETCIVVVDTGSQSGRSMEIGIIVDAVDEVIAMTDADIEPAPSLGASVDTRFILGVGKSAERVTLLLDIDSALSEGEQALLAQLG